MKVLQIKWQDIYTYDQGTFEGLQSICGRFHHLNNLFTKGLRIQSSRAYLIF